MHWFSASSCKLWGAKTLQITLKICSQSILTSASVQYFIVLYSWGLCTSFPLHGSQTSCGPMENIRKREKKYPLPWLHYLHYHSSLLHSLQPLQPGWISLSTFLSFRLIDVCVVSGMLSWLSFHMLDTTKDNCQQCAHTYRGIEVKPEEGGRFQRVWKCFIIVVSREPSAHRLVKVVLTGWYGFDCYDCVEYEDAWKAVGKQYICYFSVKRKKKNVFWDIFLPWKRYLCHLLATTLIWLVLTDENLITQYVYMHR